MKEAKSGYYCIPAFCGGFVRTSRCEGPSPLVFSRLVPPTVNRATGYFSLPGNGCIGTYCPTLALQKGQK